MAAGTALGWAEQGAVAALPALAAAVGAVLIQAGTNLHNDAADGERGTDRPGRLGPPRATAEGWASPGAVRRAAGLCFALSGIAGLYLVAVGGWPILVLGVFSLVAGWAYSGGPRPISHSPWGEVAVLAFFGVGAVAGSCFLQTGRVAWGTVMAGLAVGSPAAAVLLVNNLRDRCSDRKAGRRTLVRVLGVRMSVAVYGLLMSLPFVLSPGVIARVPGDHLLSWLPLLALAPAAWLVWRVAGAAARPGAELNTLLARTALVQVLFTVLLCIALVVQPP